MFRGEVLRIGLNWVQVGEFEHQVSVYRLMYQKHWFCEFIRNTDSIRHIVLEKDLSFHLKQSDKKLKDKLIKSFEDQFPNQLSCWKVLVCGLILPINKYAALFLRQIICLGIIGFLLIAHINALIISVYFDESHLIHSNLKISGYESKPQQINEWLDYSKWEYFLAEVPGYLISMSLSQDQFDLLFKVSDSQYELFRRNVDKMSVFSQLIHKGDGLFQVIGKQP